MDSFFINGIGVLGPGLDGWEKAQSVLTGETAPALWETPRAVADLLPPNERRRAGAAIRLALHVAAEAVAGGGLPAVELPSVFSSCHGDIQIARKNCITLTADQPFVSPTLFHNSVHNAPSGYWHIATGSQQPSNSLSGGNDSFALGLMEACSLLAAAADERSGVLLVCSDPALPDAFQPFDHISKDFGVALVLSRRSGRWGKIGLVPVADREPEPGNDEDPIARLADSNPAARSLALLQAVARRQPMDLPAIGCRYQPC